MGGAAADRGAEPAREQLLYEVGLRAGRCISLPPTAMSTAPRKPPTATTVAASGTVRANASLDEGSGRSRGEGSRAARCVALVFRVRDRTRSQAYTCGYKEDTKRRIQRAGGGGGCLHPRELRAVPNRGGRRFVARARRGSERVHPRVEACSPRALHKIRLTKSAAGTGAPQGEGACPLSTRGGTRLVRLVRGKGGGGGGRLRAVRRRDGPTTLARRQHFDCNYAVPFVWMDILHGTFAGSYAGRAFPLAAARAHARHPAPP